MLHRFAGPLDEVNAFVQSQVESSNLKIPAGFAPGWTDAERVSFLKSVAPAALRANPEAAMALVPDSFKRAAASTGSNTLLLLAGAAVLGAVLLKRKK